MESWNAKNVYKIRDYKEPKFVQEPEPEKGTKEIEPWLTALLQSEHLSLFVGSGLPSAVHILGADKPGAGMGLFELSVFKEQIDNAMNKSAKATGRGKPNIEDQIKVANELIKGLEIYLNTDIRGTKKLKKDLEKLKIEIANGLDNFANDVLRSEKNIICGNAKATEYLMSFLISFASRSATRERLNLFTINYDRVIEFGAELSGIRLIDRFLGTINPIFRSSRLDIDMHYNPPGIRGEPRYLEGVVQFTKLHGSLDWIYQNRNVRRIALPYGATEIKNYLPDSVNNLMIYPNSSKDRETSEYPYVELFRDFASSICRPNSTVVVYGYSFGDEHINRVIEDMLTISSAHLVIISYNDEGDRIQHFYNRVKRPTQITLLVGNHFGDLKILVDNYLPKPAIDKTTLRLTEILKARGYLDPDASKKDVMDNNL
ncbi:TPA: SIR2 family protein [Legionella bozemanae]